jgi:hypothetical protein
LFILDPDVWWHLKVGQTILATHHWPTTDAYSFTAHGQPWIAEEWLGEVLAGWSVKIGGLQGLDLLFLLVGVAIVVALYALVTMRSNSKAGFVAAVLVWPLALLSFTLRPQMLAYLFLILTLIVLELFRGGKRRAIWFLPVIFLAWVNTHGTWIIGLGIVVVYWLCGLVDFRIGAIEAKRWSVKEREQIALGFLLSLIAITITPYGTEPAAFPFRFAFSLRLVQDTILEWQQMSFGIAAGKIFLSLVLGFFLLQMAFDLKWRAEEIVLFVVGTVMACLHIRFVMLFVPFCAPLLGRFFARWIDYDRSIDKYVLNGILMASAVAAMVHYFPSRSYLENRVAQESPVKAVEYLRQHPRTGPMFDSYGFGGYLIWALGPEQKVFIDGRAELYEWSGVLNDYMELASLEPAGLDVLRRYQIRSCLLRRGEALSTVLAAMPEWNEVYSDDVSTLFVRRSVQDLPARD